MEAVTTIDSTCLSGSDILTGGLGGRYDGGGGMYGRGRLGSGRENGRAVGGAGKSDKSRRASDDAEV